jgi:hypothetical protein
MAPGIRPLVPKGARHERPCVPPAHGGDPARHLPPFLRRRLDLACGIQGHQRPGQLRDEGNACGHERAGRPIPHIHIRRCGREPLAFRRRRLGRVRVRFPQRPVEVRRRGLDLGLWQLFGRHRRRLRDQGDAVIGQSAGRPRLRRLVDRCRRHVVALRRPRHRLLRALRLPERPVEIRRHGLDLGLGQQHERAVRQLWDQGSRRPGKRSRGPRRHRFLERRRQHSLAPRRLRPDRRQPGLPERPLEVRRHELDLGLGQQFIRLRRRLRDQGGRSPGERAQRAWRGRQMEGRGRELLALRRHGYRHGWVRVPERPVEIRRHELDLDLGKQFEGSARQLRNEGRRGLEQRPRRTHRRHGLDRRRWRPLDLRRYRRRYVRQRDPERPLEVRRHVLDVDGREQHLQRAGRVRDQGRHRTRQRPRGPFLRGRMVRLHARWPAPLRRIRQRRVG